MANATGVTERVSPKRLCDVLALFVPPNCRERKYERAMDKLWGDWCVCVSCHKRIAPAAPALWNGEGFVHEGCVRSGETVPWSEVALPGYGGSVADRLEQKKEREEVQEAA